MKKLGVILTAVLLLALVCTTAFAHGHGWSRGQTPAASCEYSCQWDTDGDGICDYAWGGSGCHSGHHGHHSHHGCGR